MFTAVTVYTCHSSLCGCCVRLYCLLHVCAWLQVSRTASLLRLLSFPGLDVVYLCTTVAASLCLQLAVVFLYEEAGRSVNLEWDPRQLGSWMSHDEVRHAPLHGVLLACDLWSVWRVWWNSFSSSPSFAIGWGACCESYCRKLPFSGVYRSPGVCVVWGLTCMCLRVCVSVCLSECA